MGIYGTACSDGLSSSLQTRRSSLFVPQTALLQTRGARCLLHKQTQPFRASRCDADRPGARICPVTIGQPSTSIPSRCSNSNQLTLTLSFPRGDAGFYLRGYFLFLGSSPSYFCYTEKSQHLVSQHKQIWLPLRLRFQRLGRIPAPRCEELPVAKYTDKKDV